tara:strand:+ start:364 stop:774 length:411 start_codon:yes stop_codon:yes gene_type:complete
MIKILILLLIILLLYFYKKNGGVLIQFDENGLPILPDFNDNNDDDENSEDTIVTEEYESFTENNTYNNLYNYLQFKQLEEYTNLLWNNGFEDIDFLENNYPTDNEVLEALGFNDNSIYTLEDLINDLQLGKGEVPA